MTVPTESALVLEATCSVCYTPYREGESPTPSAVENNLKVFQACDLLDERPASDRLDLESPIALELKRLDLKMSLMLELLMEGMAKGETRSVDSEVALDFRGVSWSPAPASLSVGQRGRIELFVHRSLPRPLRFNGSIVEVDPVRGSARLEFDRLDELEADQLERLIFKRHRRKIADVRGLKKPS
jgi:hypothetical protein